MRNQYVCRVQRTQSTKRGQSRSGYPYLERRCEADPDLLLIVHGYAPEHAARYREYAHFLADNGVYVVAPDLRGHGLSEGQRGHVDDYAEYFLDVEEAKRLLLEDTPTLILGHSNGGLIVARIICRLATVASILRY